jgi:hypothetical protein
MLLTKKSKCLEDKPKQKNSDTAKKLKKNKNNSPNKVKVTPDKKHKKDENAYPYRQSHYNHTQPIDMSKLKEKDGWKTSTKKYGPDSKNKLLTTSPVIFDRSHSNSHKKSKDKSKDRSVSRVHTHRSYHGDKEKDLIKNVTRKLYTHTKENKKEKSLSKSKSKSKSKSRTRINTDRDISPIRDLKKTRTFNVTDREITFKKTETADYKKFVKKKVKNRMKVDDVYSYLPADRQDIEREEPKVKLKKKVP